MKIALLLNSLVSHGGIEKIQSQKIEAWIKLYGYDVILITKNQNGLNLVYEVKSEFKHIDLNIEHVNKGKLSYFKNIKSYCSFFFTLKGILEKEKVDVVFTTLTSIDSLLVPFIKKNIPKVLEFHSSGFLLHTPTWKFKKKIIEKYNKVIVLNNDEKSYFGLNNLMSIPNFVDIRPLKENLKERKNIIITAGRIDTVKQFDHLISIWKEIHKKNDQWEVHLYGAGPEDLTDFLKKEIKNHGVEDSFILKGLTSKLDVKMKEASIFALTSSSDCFPMVLLEAMNCGLPIVSYDSPNGPRNIISNNEDGFLVSINNKNQFSEKLNRLINDRELRYKYCLAAINNVERFSKDKVMSKWNDLVIELKKH